MVMETYQRGPSLQSVLASLLWSLGSQPMVPACPRQRAIVIHQLRFVAGHPEAEALLKDVAQGLLNQMEDQAASARRADALTATYSVTHAGSPAQALNH
jgi:hypothetical protein